MECNRPLHGIIYSKPYGRWSFADLAERAKKKEMLRWLNRFSRSHIQKNRKQLVVFAFDYIGHMINLDGVYEIADLDFFFDAMSLNKGMFSEATAIDIGANIGNHSLYFSDYFQKVVSFEPNPRTYKVLQLNAELAKNVLCCNEGISDANTKLLLEACNTNSGRSAITDNANGNARSIRVRTLDSAIDETEIVRLIKIDVEGHEEKALIGAEQTIRRNKPIILFEQHKEDFCNGSTASIELLKSYGYVNFAVIENRPLLLKSIPGFLRQKYRSLLRLTIGQTRNLVIKNNIEPGSYPFIVAIPDWVRLVD
ncbi:MAG: FkbM family methyltransferase [Sulfuritalea sp.]|jgi:FkbM family methyltransferase|nr:FkbM family methyltransferase [Sulfuritalea sp.]MBP8867550.1 FkbM family methyltransferase [Propionivibrio sp.]MBP9159008.1 FkbM family methyltransferase [Sphingobium sp.]